MAVLVLGAYGLIGRSVVTELLRDGYGVIGVGRDVESAERMEPKAAWRRADISRLTRASDWVQLLNGVDAVVNASGALQTGLKDDVASVQTVAMHALFEAAVKAGVGRFVQISAPGAHADASTLFMRSKAVADEALKASGLSYVILRPALVIAPAAYGGTALLRALAAFPIVTPLVLGEARVRTVALNEVTAAVSQALSGAIESGSDLVLAEADSHSLAEATASIRGWLGLAPALALRLPAFAGRVISFVADALGWLGWRSPLRTSAMKVMSEGVATEGGSARPLQATLAAMPSTPQDRWFARLWLLKPAVFGLLAIFWIASGVIGFIQRDIAARILTDAGLAQQTAMSAVVAGSIGDIVVGLTILFRPTARLALFGMLAITGAYVVGSAALTPLLWLDPLGPMVKTLPLVVLILVAFAILEDR